MKKSWHLVEKILTGEKAVESRWYKTKRTPWNMICPGDIIYFKNSGEPVTVKTKVSKVIQYEGLTEKKIDQIMKKYGKADLGTSEILPEIRTYVKGKKYCILVSLICPKKVAKPFEIDKTGFGSMSAWITVKNIKQITIAD